MKKPKNEVKRQWRISSANVKKGLYISIGVPRVDNKGYELRLGYGYVEDLKQYHNDPVKVIKALISDFPLSWTREQARARLDELFKTKSGILKEAREKYRGYELIEKLFNHLDIFSNCTETKSTTLRESVLQLIYQRIKNPLSVFGTYKSVKKESVKSYSKNSFYRSLDYIAENQTKILKNINESISNKHKRNINVLWFDSTTAYFETFSRDGNKMPGYSKDGKFKEDQIVIAMATDENGIPFHYEVFPGNTADPNTFRPFMVKMSKIYNIENVTIIADKGMSTNSNIRFIESKGWNYIISYRLKASNEEFKKYVLNKSDYIEENGFIHKSRIVPSIFKGKRPNGHERKQIIAYSDERAKKDRNDRNILISNFTKKMNKEGFVSQEKIAGSKKYKFFKPINMTTFYELDIEKIKEDEEYDGFYVYETNRFDLSVSEIINLYSKQWQIESNFKTLKGTLSLRPMYLSTWKHIYGYICLCFISLVFINYLVFVLNGWLLENNKPRITEHKIISIINDVKDIEILANNNLIDSTPLWNTDVKESWDDYQLILEILKIKNIL